jgi:pyruvate formate lyase activating enzyme
LAPARARDVTRALGFFSHNGAPQPARIPQAHETDVWFEITTLLIPGENDASMEIEAESRWVIEHLGPDVPLHFTAFHPDWKMMDTPPTPPATPHMARRIAMEAGIRYVYTGNIHDPAGQTTYCHACGAVLIGRDWYDLTAWTLSAEGRCVECGTPCAGVFDAAHGSWGRRRQSIRVQAFANS